MAVTATPIYPQSLFVKTTQFLPADTTTAKEILAVQTNGIKVENILVTSTDTSARDLVLYIRQSSTNYLLGTYTIPANSGNTNALVAINLFTVATTALPTSTDSNGNKFLYLDSGTSLQASMGTSITAAKLVNVHVTGSNF